MGIFFTCLLIGISLSMDAFSLALVYGTYGMSKKNEVLLSIVVGVFHFFMPLLGLFFGKMLMKFFIFDLNLVVGIIFGIIGIEMILSSIREEEVKVLVHWLGFLLFGLSVSIDSFTTGIGLSAISSNYVGVAVMFMLVSGIFTYLGLHMGNKLSRCFGKYATIAGGIVMILFAISYVF